LNIGTEEAEAAPVVDDEIEGEEVEEPEQEEQEAEESEEQETEEAEQQPKKREPRWKREAERARREESARIELEQRLAQMEAENKNLNEVLKNKLSGKSDEDVTDEQKDEFLRQNGFNPDDIVDKDTVIQILESNGKTMQSVDDLRGKMIANTVQSSIMAAKSALPDIKDAMSHFASVKAEEFKYMASQRGQQMSDAEARQQALNAASHLMISAAESGQDAATAVYDYAKAIGYKPKKALPQGDNIDITKLQELRDSAGKSSYTVAPVGSKGPNGFAATAAKMGLKADEMFDL